MPPPVRQSVCLVSVIEYLSEILSQGRIRNSVTRYPKFCHRGIFEILSQKYIWNSVVVVYPAEIGRQLKFSQIVSYWDKSLSIWKNYNKIKPLGGTRVIHQLINKTLHFNLASRIQPGICNFFIFTTVKGMGILGSRPISTSGLGWWWWWYRVNNNLSFDIIKWFSSKTISDSWDEYFSGNGLTLNFWTLYSHETHLAVLFHIKFVPTRFIAFINKLNHSKQWYLAPYRIQIFF